MVLRLCLGRPILSSGYGGVRQNRATISRHIHIPTARKTQDGADSHAGGGRAQTEISPTPMGGPAAARLSTPDAPMPGSGPDREPGVL